MASLSQIPRDEKRRIADETQALLVARAANAPPDPILDPFIPRTAAVGNALATRVEEKTAANAERIALLTQCDIEDDEVDRWDRHIYWYIDTETLRRHAPRHAAIVALKNAAYPNGLAHIDDRIPDQNESVRATSAVLGHPDHADVIADIQLPSAWIGSLDIAVKKSEACFTAYQAAMGDGTTAVALGKDAESDWVSWARAISHAIALRTSGIDHAEAEAIQQLIAPLTNAVRLLRAHAKARATRRKSATP